MQGHDDGSTSAPGAEAVGVTAPPRAGPAPRTMNGQTAMRARFEPASAPGLLQRVLLTTDGSVGRILQAYAGEPIEVVKLEQWSAPCGVEHPALEAEADDEGLRRRVILRGSRSARSLIYADCLIALARLHPTVRSGLLATAAPIGDLLATVRAETFREVLSWGRERARTLGVHFGIGETEEVFFRTYRIVEDRRPIMLITETFPTTWFLS